MAEMRRDLLSEPERTGETVTAVCRRKGVSRDSFYTYKRRFEVAGEAGLAPRSTRPLSSPKRIPQELEELICRMRGDHPRWGARRIRAELLRVDVEPPAVSTIHCVLKRNHLVADQPNRKPKRPLRRFERASPNDLWQMDATEMDVGRGRACVIDILDDHARFVLASLVSRSLTAEAAWRCFELAARRHGLPNAVLTDNHLSFSGKSRGAEVAFERRLKALGIRHLLIAKGHPQTQGKIERYHGTLKQWLGDQALVTDLAQLERLVARFVAHYNTERPHQALDDLTPADRYRRSVRGYKLRSQAEPSYPESAIVRRVSRHGRISYDQNNITLPRHMGGCIVRVEPSNGRLKVFFGEQLIRDVPHLRDGGRHPLSKPPRGE